MMEDVASEDRKSTQPRPRQGLHAWLRPLRKVWLAMRHRQISQQEESMSEIGIRLTYDLKDTLTANPFVSLWRMTTGFRAIYLVAIVAAGLAALSGSAVFYLLRYFVDDVLPGSDRRGDLPWVAAGIIGLALLQGLFTFGMGRSAAQTAEGVARRLRNYLYDQIQRLTFTYHDNMQTGELIQRATSDVDTIRRLFQDQLIGIGRIGLLLVVNLSALVLLHGWLALLSIPVFPIVSVASYIFFKRVGTLFESYQSQDAVVSNRLQETLSGVRVVKAFARQSFEIERFDEENWEKYRRGVRIANLHTVFWPLIEILSGAQILFGVYMASMMVLNGEITLGTYIAFIGLLAATIWPVQGLDGWWPMSQPVWSRCSGCSRSSARNGNSWWRAARQRANVCAASCNSGRSSSPMKRRPPKKARRQRKAKRPTSARRTCGGGRLRSAATSCATSISTFSLAR